VDREASVNAVAADLDGLEASAAFRDYVARFRRRDAYRAIETVLLADTGQSRLTDRGTRA
jgi:hypothetical protein